MNELLEMKVIDDDPVSYLQSVGLTFSEFGPDSQDSGNLCYGVKVGGKRFFVKTAGILDDQKPPITHPERVALLRNAIRVAQSISHQAVPSLLNVIESPSGPMLVYEWLEGELLGVPPDQRSDRHSPFQRFCALSPKTISSCLATVYEVHARLAQAGWIAVDFYDGCLMYDFSSGQIHVIDLDMYRQGPFENAMGRMFGSTRFMAPEEFELGSMIDQRTNVFTMGRTAAVFLSDGSLRFETFRGSAAEYAVMNRACQPDRSQRPATLDEFYDAWQDARNE